MVGVRPPHACEGRSEGLWGAMRAGRRGARLQAAAGSDTNRPAHADAAADSPQGGGVVGGRRGASGMAANGYGLWQCLYMVW